MLGPSQAHFHEAGRVVTVQVAEDEAALLWNAQLCDTGCHELVRGHLLILLQALLVVLGAGYGEDIGGLQGVVQLHERIAASKRPPQQRHGVGIIVGLVLLLGHPAVEALDGAQAQLQGQTSLEERGVLVGALVEHIVRGFDGAAVDGGAGGKGRRSAVAKEGGGGGGLGALGIACAAVRVARVLALVALVGHEGGRSAAGGYSGVL